MAHDLHLQLDKGNPSLLILLDFPLVFDTAEHVNLLDYPEHAFDITTLA